MSAKSSHNSKGPCVSASVLIISWYPCCSAAHSLTPPSEPKLVLSPPLHRKDLLSPPNVLMHHHWASDCWSSTWPPGGAGNSAHLLHIGLPAYGHESSIHTTRHTLPPSWIPLVCPRAILPSSVHFLPSGPPPPRWPGGYK